MLILPIALYSYEEMGLGTLSVSQLQLETQKRFITELQSVNVQNESAIFQYSFLLHHKANHHLANGSTEVQQCGQV